METYLVVDERERSVRPHIEEAFKASGGKQVVSTINTGDYLICRHDGTSEPETLACIERKTYKDFAASLSDNRYENTAKMLDLRAGTGCQLYYLVEGSPLREDSSKNKIKNKAIRTAMIHLPIRDGIHILETADSWATAQKLADFVREFAAMDFPYRHPISATGPRPAGGTKEQNPLIPAVVTGVIQKPDTVLAVEMWAQLRGISAIMGRILAGTTTVKRLVDQTLTEDDIKALRTGGGRLLAKEGRNSLLGLRKGHKKESVRILSGIPGISAATAASILMTWTLPKLLSFGEPEMANLTFTQRERTVKLGAARARNITRLMNFVSNDAAEDPKAEEEDDTADIADEAAVEEELDIGINDDDLADILRGL